MSPDDDSLRPAAMIAAMNENKMMPMRHPLNTPKKKLGTRDLRGSMWGAAAPGGVTGEGAGAPLSSGAGVGCISLMTSSTSPILPAFRRMFRQKVAARLR